MLLSSFPILSIERVSASGKLPLIIFFEAQDDKINIIKQQINLFMILFFNKKKKKLNSIYNKIVKESKDSFSLIYKNTKNIEQFREFFQLNLILILWYMKKNKIKDKYLDYLIKIFIKDLEGMVIELGGSETSFRKKIRTMIENFYGRLYAFSELFDKYKHLNKHNSKSLISNNFYFLSDPEPILRYLNKNISFIKNLEEEDFWNANFVFN